MKDLRKIRCFSCNQFGHYSSNCPENKEKKRDKNRNKNKSKNKNKDIIYQYQEGDRKKSQYIGDRKMLLCFYNNPSGLTIVL